MAIGTRIGPDGRPIEEPFFGLGQTLAQLPGTPVLGGAPPYTSGYDPSGGTPVSNTPAPGSGQGIGTTTGGGGPPKLPGEAPRNPTEGIEGNFQIPGDTPTSGFQQPGSFGSAPQVNPGLPPPATTAGTGGFFGGQSPFQQGVTGTLNNETVPFNSSQYVTPEAAQRLGSLLGANVVEQNLSGMSSPGSGAPSAPLLGLDFGRGGDVQDAAMGATQLARGDRPEDVAARYKAGMTTKAWAGDNPIPQLAENWDAPYWNRSTPVSTNTPNAQQAGFFGQGGGSPDQQQAFFTWLRGQVGQG